MNKTRCWKQYELDRNCVELTKVPHKKCGKKDRLRELYAETTNDNSIPNNYSFIIPVVGTH